MSSTRFPTVAILCLVLPSIAAAAGFDPPEHPLFTPDAVHEIHLTFHQPGWWDSLVHNYEDFEDAPYMAAEFDWEDTHFDSIGVRFKGNSSYWHYPGDKKPFKLDFDRYVDEQTLGGLKKINLSNGFKDPSFVRERCFWDLVAAADLPEARTNYGALYLNGEYWGLYTVVEQVDGTFAELRFGGNEDGNLWQGDPHGDLMYRGPNESVYYDHYELHTNESQNDWSALVDFIDALNFTPQPERPDSLSPRLELGSALGMLALNNLTANLDSYSGSGHNWYLYHRDLDGRMIAISWDANEAWGCFNMGLPVHAMKTLPPFWMGGPPNSRPLCAELWQIPEWEDLYLGFLRELMADAADPDTLLGRMETLRDLIRPWVYADTRKMYSDSEFENAMTVDIGGGPGGVSPALEPFIRDRHSYLLGVIGSWDASAYGGLVLNELMPVNDSTHADEFGEFDDWVEIANAGASPLDLAGLSLTDDLAYPSAFVFPAITLDPGEYLVVWADDSTAQGSLHAGFKLDGDGECLYLIEDGVIIDQVIWGSLGADQSWGRWPDGTGDWQLLSQATPGAENQHSEEPEEVVLFLNEFLAINDTNIQDETGAFEDWLEIYNPGPATVEMGGLFLTDDLSLTTQWQLPDTTLAAGDFLLVWCDNDEGDGPLHTNFKLSGSGESIGLFGRIAAGNEAIDTYVFGAQTADVSEGRQSDGGEPWVFFTEPTPGTSNEGTAAPPPAAFALRLLPNHPNPFNPTTRLRFELPREGHARLSIHDVAGGGPAGPGRVSIPAGGGRQVVPLRDGPLAAGPHELDWEADDLPTGIYFAKLSMEQGVRTQKLVLLR